MQNPMQLSELVILKEIAQTLNEGIDLDVVLDEVLDKLLTITGLGTGWIYLIDEEGDYELAASRNLPPALTNKVHQPLCRGECWCVGSFNSGKLYKASNIMVCKRLENAIEGQWGDTKELTHHATVPLRSGEQLVGILNVASPRKITFAPHELALLESVALQIGAVIQRIRLTHKEHELQLIAERNRLARELHDSVNQLLFSINLTAKAGMSIAGDEQIRETFEQIHTSAQSAQSEMRSLIWQLRPSELEEGLMNAFVSYGQMLGLTVHLELNGLLKLPSCVEETLWRIGQEAFNNVVKYSGCLEVYVKLQMKQSAVEMIVWDEGVGFCLSASSHIPSLGLKSMRERAQLLHGSVRIESSPGKGTVIIAELPI